MRTGIIFGCWDLFHVGHLNMLKKASEFCSALYIGVFSDEAVKSYKGHYPIISQNDRLEILKSIRLLWCNVYPFIIGEREAREWKFDFLFVSNKMKGKKLLMVTENFQGSTVYIPYTERISTGKIITKCKIAEIR